MYTKAVSTALVGYLAITGAALEALATWIGLSDGRGTGVKGDHSEDVEVF